MSEYIERRFYNKLAVKFFSIKTNECIGIGYYIPSREFFENTYIPEHFPDAKYLGDGKYQIDKTRYIRCVVVQ